jgi:hypothetical protein
MTQGFDTKFLLKNGGLLVGAAACTFMGLQALKFNEDYANLRKHLDSETLEILKASEWIDVCFRMEEFHKLVPKKFIAFLKCVIYYIKFKNLEYIEKKRDAKKIKLLPRIARKYLHPIIESVRYMRAELEKHYPEYLVDFDELAAEVQNVHNTCASNVFLDCI